MTDDDMRRAALMWNVGHDSLQISRNLRLKEHTVYNRLDWIKRLAKQMRRNPFYRDDPTPRPDAASTGPRLAPRPQDCPAIEKDPGSRE